MARNQEQAQSMLYRFREAQNAELGIGNRKDVRRPRLASSVKTIRECEKWRGEIMREISRKVSKIQDCEYQKVLHGREKDGTDRGWWFDEVEIER